jgi:hypothetical protein
MPGFLSPDAVLCEADPDPERATSFSDLARDPLRALVYHPDNNNTNDDSAVYSDSDNWVGINDGHDTDYDTSHDIGSDFNNHHTGLATPKDVPGKGGAQHDANTDTDTGSALLVTDVRAAPTKDRKSPRHLVNRTQGLEDVFLTRCVVDWDLLRQGYDSAKYESAVMSVSRRPSSPPHTPSQ